MRSTDIGAPAVTEVEFKISLLAPEGSAVKVGQPILGFDTEALQRLLVDEQAELAEFTKKAEQKEVDLRLKLLEIEQQVAQGEADLGKAQLKAEVPAELQQRVELEKARLDHKGRQRDLENLQAERRGTQSLGEAELRSLRNQRDRARGRVAALQAAIEKMTVKAPQDGIVVYRTNWRDEKKKVGDSMWFGETVLALPDLSEMRADGFVDEADGGPVAAGQKVTIRLEARPDLDVLGRVRTVGRTVRQKSWRNPVKVYKVDIALDRTDSAVMRPAMRLPRRDRDRADTGPAARPPRCGLPARERSGGLGAPRPGLVGGAGASRPQQPPPRRDRRGPRGGRPAEPDGPRGRGPGAQGRVGRSRALSAHLPVWLTRRRLAVGVVASAALLARERGSPALRSGGGGIPLSGEPGTREQA